jgi:DMSO/TMAO reductase YedYZ molybdopterin-dependent catalytic subunit
MTRRDWLKLTPAALPLLGTAQGQTPPTFPGMIVRMSQPENLEFPFAALNGVQTPTEHFFVRSHFAVPKLDPAAFQLTVEGAVEKPLTLTLADLQGMAKVTKSITLECAGNGRIFLAPQVRGLQWGFGGVGTATWTGVPLGAILERAKLKPTAKEVLLVGADLGSINADPPSPGPINFDRSIPLKKAKQDECLLAYNMNDNPLTPSHGAPLRAVIGGWYGMAAVKWLTKIIVLNEAYHGFWQTMDYAIYQRLPGGQPTLKPLTAMQPKAAIARPGLSEIVPLGQPYKLHGAAWAGEQTVDKVEFSVDAGKNWTTVRLSPPTAEFTWQLWEHTWTPNERGPVKLLVKATDKSGRTQPVQRDPDRRTYMINHLVPVEVTVR